MKKSFLRNARRTFRCVLFGCVKVGSDDRMNVIHFTDVPIRLIEDEDEDRGAELFQLLKKTKLDLKQCYEIAYKIFEADPTEQEYYEYCMLEFPEETDNLLHLQQITGLALQKSILEKALKKMFEKSHIIPKKKH